MSDFDGDFGAGVGATVLAVVVVTFAFFIGGLITKSRIEGDCLKMGQTTILNTVYKCERDDNE